MLTLSRAELRTGIEVAKMRPPAVYVDDAFISKDDEEYCHLMADDLDTLHAFAQAIGLKREWCHSGDHYDVTRAMRRKAVEAGAREITAVEMVGIRRKLRKAKTG